MATGEATALEQMLAADSPVKYSVLMSKEEIIEELPKLSPEDRAEVQARLDELAGQGWLDDGELTDEEKRLLDSRLDECERHPSSFVPWEQAKAQITASLKK